MRLHRILAVILLTTGGFCHAQVFTTESGCITFFSSAPLENITAINKKVSCIFDFSKSAIAFSVQIDGFSFDKSLMQDHFNEKYMESEKYPKATFQGSINNPTKNSEKVTATGKLTIHGITKDVQIEGEMKKEAGTIRLKSTFVVNLQDYNIERPQIMWQNIAEQVEVSLDIKLKAK